MAAVRSSRMVFARASRARNSRLWHCSTWEASEGVPVCLPTAWRSGRINAGTWQSLSKRRFHSSRERTERVLHSSPRVCELLLCCH